MIKDVKNLIISHNDINDGIFINYDIDKYVLKLSKFATIIPYYSGTILNGFISYYSNDISNGNAYLTMIIINKPNRGQGLGKLLLECSINDLKNKGFKNYKLEVLKTNFKAIEIYKKYGFKKVEDRGDLWLMDLNLSKVNNTKC